MSKRAFYELDVIVIDDVVYRTRAFGHGEALGPLAGAHAKVAVLSRRPRDEYIRNLTSGAVTYRGRKTATTWTTRIDFATGKRFSGRTHTGVRPQGKSPSLRRYERAAVKFNELSGWKGPASVVDYTLANIRL